MVLWSKSSTLDWKVEGSNPAAANFSFEVDDLDARRKKEDGNENNGVNITLYYIGDRLSKSNEKLLYLHLITK